jgi:DNA repair protein RadC
MSKKRQSLATLPLFGDGSGDHSESTMGEAAVAYISPKAKEDAIIAEALAILNRRIRRSDVLTDPASTRQYLSVKLAPLEHEVFMVIWLDTRNQIIATEELFRGTIDGASVHPREVVKGALQVNASCVIFAHNHPSGIPEPSDADRRLTTRLRDALTLVEVRVLDHFVVGGDHTVSFAERGLL